MVDSNKIANMVLIPKLKMLIHKKGPDMTKSDEKIRPVTAWENEACDGLALLAAPNFRQSIEKAQELRDRQAAYLASLPTDPREVIRAALKLMHPTGNEYPDGIEEALHLSCALEALVKEGDLDVEGRSRDAALYVASQVSNAMHRAARQLSRVADILGNHGRLERDGQDG